MIPWMGRLQLSVPTSESRSDEELAAATKIMSTHGFDFQAMRHRDERAGRARLERATWNMFVLENLWELGVRPSGGSGRKWGSLLG